MCSVELPFSLIVDNAMRRSRARPERRASPARPVRRALFVEPVDHAETARALAREFAQLQADAESRWNFDFEQDRPLEGRFEWEPVPEAPRPAEGQRGAPSERPRRPKQRKLTDFMSKRKRPSPSLKSTAPVKSSKTVTASTQAT